MRRPCLEGVVGPRWYLEWQRDTQGCQRLSSVDEKGAESARPQGESGVAVNSLLALASLTFIHLFV